MFMEDKTEVPVVERLRASADDVARWAVALAGIPLEAELAAVGRPGDPFGLVLMEVARRVCATTGSQLLARFPGLEAADAEAEQVVEAVEWLRERADEVAASSISFARAAVQEVERHALVA